MSTTNENTIEMEGAYSGLILKSTNFAKWAEKGQAEFEIALEALIEKKTPVDAVYKRPGRGGMTFDYVSGWWMIEQLNSLFNRQWSWRIDREEVGQSQVWVRGVLTVRMAPGPDGLISKEAYGGADIKMQGGSRIIDIADDLKAASTDALKKAGSMLGIAADIYGKHGDNTGGEVVPDNKEKFAAIMMRAKNLGMDEDSLKAWILEQTDVNPGKTAMEELNQVGILKVLNKLVKMDTEESTKEEVSV